MNAVRWEKIADLFKAASSRPPVQWQEFLFQACPGDDDLRREVESLLKQPISRDGLLEDVARDVQGLPQAVRLDQAADASAQLVARTEIGRYRVLRPIGEGGMGAVYEAEQEHPRRIVALKVMKTGLVNPERLRRFQVESEALGRLQHPGIAQIFEAGAAQTGFGTQPYFAMEYIHGLPLMEYANRNHLRTKQRVELVVKVCDAMHHAHERGIIHRDLKPGNILVDESGQPKVLDFGVARIKDTETHATRQTNLGELVGTLAYMSPEQVSPEPLELDARSDVYALGVILYELLAGRRPYAISPKVFEAVRTIREDAPPALGEVTRECRGDLETIVAKALEKEMSRRYGSAAELAADLRRYLAEEPIVARRPSASYQAWKFVKRHKRFVAGTTTVLVVLVAGTVASTREAIRANRAERAALIERDRATAAEHAATAERDRARRAVQTATTERTRAEQERSRAVTASRRADTQSAVAAAVNEFLQNDLLAQASAATQSGPNTRPDPNMTVRTAVDRAAARVGEKFKSQPLVEAAIRQTLARTYYDLGLLPASQEQLERTVDLRRSVLGPEHTDTVSAMYDLASIYASEGRYAAAEPLYEKILEVRRRRLRDRHPETLAVINALANVALGQGKHARAEELLVQALNSPVRAPGKDNPATLTMLNSLGVAYSNQGKYRQAEEVYRSVVDGRVRVLGEEHPLTLLSMDNLAVACRYEGKYDEAEGLLEKALAIRRRVLGEQHPDTLAGKHSLGLVYAAESRYQEAEALLLASLEGRRRVLGEDHLYTLRTMHSIAELYQLEGKLPEAESVFTKVLDIRRRALGRGHLETIISMTSIASMRLEQHRYSEAEPLLREALKGFEKAGPDTWRRFHVQSMLGATLAAMGQYEEAEPLLISGYENMIQRRDSIPYENRLLLRQVNEWIVRLFTDSGRPTEAARWRQ